MKLLVSIAFAFFSISAFAQSKLPKFPFEAMDWTPTMEAPPAKGFKMGFYAVHFDETLLEDVIKNVASGKIVHSGSGSASTYWICYLNLLPGYREEIWITSSAELGGPGHRVTGVAAKVINRVSDNDCAKLGESMRPVTLDRGIWLGESLEFLKAKLGPPSHIERTWHSYDYRGKKEEGACPNGFDLGNSLVVQIGSMGVHELFANESVTC